MKRQAFLKQAGATCAAIVAVPTILVGQDRDKITAEEITEFVFTAHKDADKTKRIVEAKPLILNCTNQFKRGDFETAVGGASHMGRRDIADILISKGARLDIFNYAFLGYTDLVIKLVTDYPELLNSPGPHGLTLLHHAKVGEQEELAGWLQEKGLKETHFKNVFG